MSAAGAPEPALGGRRSGERVRAAWQPHAPSGVAAPREWARVAGPNAANGLLARLHTDTREAHEDVEHMVDLPASLSSRERYTRLVARFHGFHAAFEPAVSRSLDDERFLGPRRKLALLRADLLALGFSDAQAAALSTPSLPPVPSRSAALGWLYVIEGSTLGGAVIARRAERQLGLTAATGCAYFRSYGDAVGAMWTAFRAYAEAGVPSPEHKAAVQAARLAFACLQTWLQEGAAA